MFFDTVFLLVGGHTITFKAVKRKCIVCLVTEALRSVPRAWKEPSLGAARHKLAT